MVLALAPCGMVKADGGFQRRKLLLQDGAQRSDLDGLR